MDTPIVTIQEGKLKGTTGKNLDGEIFNQFFGIPYAKPPINELRFKPPQPIDAWEGVKDATKVGNASFSRDDLTREIVGSEDCLVLNVYTKTLPSSSTNLKPVMVYIHGGGLTIGSSRPGLYGPEFLLVQDIVLVTFNYRLGILGFLSLDDPSLNVSGNFGLKDQCLALKWVQRNISSFNGDPNNVTLFGESAGSGSVHFHILSTASKGLFHKAILQSGSVLNSWMWGSKNNATEIVGKIGKTVTNERDALEILKKEPVEKIFEAQEKMFDTIYPAMRRPFSVVIEKPSNSAFLTKSPIEILSEGSYNKVPIIMGYTNNEGMLLDLDELVIKTLGKTIPKFEIKNTIPWHLDIPKESDKSQEFCDKMKKLYFNGTDNYNDLHDIMTDCYFLVGIIESLKYHLQTSENNVYLYRVTITSQLNFLKRVMNKLDEPGVCHADDLGYLFHSEITPNIQPGSLEDKSLRSFVQLWTNFAKYGNPTPNNKLNVVWKPVPNQQHLMLLEIGENLVMRDIPERNRLNVWDEILRKSPFVKFN